jgi:hypothetical protein
MPSCRFALGAWLLPEPRTPSRRRLQSSIRHIVPRRGQLLLPIYLATDVTRYVFEYASGKTVLKFAVRSDAMPVFPVPDGEA